MQNQSTHIYHLLSFRDWKSLLTIRTSLYFLPGQGCRTLYSILLWVLLSRSSAWQPRFSTNGGWHPGQAVAPGMRASCGNRCWDCWSRVGEPIHESIPERLRWSPTVFLALIFRAMVKVFKTVHSCLKELAPHKRPRKCSFQNIFPGMNELALCFESGSP